MKSGTNLGDEMENFSIPKARKLAREMMINHDRIGIILLMALVAKSDYTKKAKDFALKEMEQLCNLCEF
tara:strand:+ start:329 stop:535 length:207 start_codon:yes stop_codon:yes gene_type:complete